MPIIPKFARVDLIPKDQPPPVATITSEPFVNTAAIAQQLELMRLQQEAARNAQRRQSRKD